MHTETVVGPEPVFVSITIGTYTLRIATQTDVDAGEATAVGKLIIEEATDKTKQEF